MTNEPLPDYSDYAYEHRPPPGSFRDWLQKHSVQRIGLWLTFLGFIPATVYWLIAGGPDQIGYIRFMDYLLAFWLFACWASAFTLFALKGIAPGIVTIYGVWAKIINGFFAIACWGFALLSLYWGLQLLLGGR